MSNACLIPLKVNFQNQIFGKEMYPAILSSDLAGQVPEWVQLIPFGAVSSKKGDFINDEDSMKAIIQAFLGHGVDMVVDYEHQTLFGDQAPASGWIKELASRGSEGLWARVEWTETANGYIAAKEYRYLSPVVLVRKSDSRAVAIHSVGLTNTPATDGILPIVNKDNKIEEVKNVDLLQKLAKALGLAEGDPTEEKVMEALKALKDQPAAMPTEVLALLDLKEGASVTEVKGRVIALKNPSGYVKAEEFRSLQDKLAERDRDELVSLALSEGKVTPAQKAWAEQYALKDPEGFKAFIKDAPQVVPLKEIEKGGNFQRKLPISDDVQLSINKMLGVDEETFKKYGGTADDSAE